MCFLKVVLNNNCRAPTSGSPLLRKFGNLSIRENLVTTSAYASPLGRPPHVMTCEPMSSVTLDLAQIDTSQAVK